MKMTAMAIVAVDMVDEMTTMMIATAEEVCSVVTERKVWHYGMVVLSTEV